MNQIAIVTGGAGDIGRSLAIRLAREGATVVIADINLPGAQAVAETVQRAGGNAQAVILDVSNETEFRAVVDQVVAEHGQLNLLFNNAATAVVGEMRDGNFADFRRVIEVNLFGVVHGSMAAYTVMRRQGFGHILNVGSITGLLPTPIITAYSTSKWGVIGFSLALREEAAHFGVKVSVACPGLVRTNIGERNIYWNVRKEDHLAQLPLKWAITPDQAAAGILRCVAKNKGILVFPFSVRLAWWIHRVCPPLLAPVIRKSVERYRTVRLNG